MLVSLVLLGGVAHAGTGDQDGDGIPDTTDNCPSVYNPNQADFNHNGVGDACQDSDSDGLTDQYELTTPYANPVLHTTLYTDPANRDSDGDGWGDGFETNTAKTDPTHADSEGDGWEDSTEYQVGTDPWKADTDADGFNDPSDNCPTIANPDQKDNDHDGIGDACDPTPNPPPPPCDQACQAQKAVQDAVNQIPSPDVRPATDVAQMGSDGYVLKIVQTDTNQFTLSAYTWPSVAQVGFNLPDNDTWSVNGPVAAYLYTPGSSPSSGSRLNLYWSYSSLDKTLTVKLILNQVYNNVFVAFAAPPVGYPRTCSLSSVNLACLNEAMAFYNPEKSMFTEDALDAVPAQTTIR